MARIDIAGHPVGDGQATFIIAEAGVNHNGDIDLAHKLIDAAAETGADAVKFQTYLTEELTAPDAPLAGHHVANVGHEMSHFQLLRKLQLPWDQHGPLKAHCDELGLIFISTPYDIPSARFLVDFGCPAIKIASSEMTNLPLLDAVAAGRAPVILSTGMSEWTEIEQSVAFLQERSTALCVLKCTSNYPCSPESVNLRGIERMRDAFPDAVIGLSDHTERIEVSVAALGLGTAVIEKHFTLDKKAWGPDHRASLEPDEFTQLVMAVRLAEAAMGERDWHVADEETAQRDAMRKGIYARHAIKRGTRITVDDVLFLRPRGDIGPREFYLEYQGREARTDIAQGALLGVAAFTADADSQQDDA